MKFNIKNLIRIILCSIPLIFGIACLFATSWYISVFGDLGFESILFTLLSDLSTTESTTVYDYLLRGLLPTVLCSAALLFVIFLDTKKPIIKTKKDVKIYPFSKRFSTIISLCLAAVLIINAGLTSHFIPFLRDTFQKSDLYETEYVDPESVNIEFPDQKRNLIVIYLESMETTYLSEQEGGAIDVNLIPELTALAKENTNFSHNDGVGGFETLAGATFTTGALLSFTSGIPLKVKLALGSNGYSTDDTFLPGITTLTEILNSEGYYQAFMVGSDASFGGRRDYFTTHGIDKIYDHNTAITDGIIPEGYHVWWGMEDYYLFEYAKKELTEISKKQEPFAFSMLTVDTHHIGGYICNECQSDHAEQYENALSCSSRQTLKFVEWIKEQDFYENTTVIVTGDHLTMDGAYISRNVSKDYTRHVYNCFINSAASTENTKNRNFAAVDMFPTILASIGCEIEGERLGLGTNLFSNTETLCERIGRDELNRLLPKSSDYYNEFY